MEGGEGRFDEVGQWMNFRRERVGEYIERGKGEEQGNRADGDGKFSRQGLNFPQGEGNQQGGRLDSRGEGGRS